jgi:hypothetical protein
MTDEEWVKIENDWLIAKFQLVCGAILAMLTGVIVATLTGQLNPVLGVACTVEGMAWLVFVWQYFTRRAQNLIDSLKFKTEAKGVD